jgi:2-polyprenyl-3-methyl-5-hydroxy-6-metoxy-1,4-benzoquinol methylase
MMGQAAGSAEAAQRHSLGDSSAAIHAGALDAAGPASGLSWLDLGCGTGTVLREVRDRYEPRSLIGVDVIDWLAGDLRDDVQVMIGSAEDALSALDPVDRVLMVEVIEHLGAPWTVLGAAARLVAPGGRIVVTTPSLVTLRSRIELLVRGRLTAFRPDNLPHLTPALPHVIERVLSDAGLEVSVGCAGVDVVPLSGGRLWPAAVHRRAPRLTSVSLVVSGRRPAAASPRR